MKKVTQLPIKYPNGKTVLFCDHVKNIRIFMGMSQAELGKALGKTARFVKTWEGGYVKGDRISLLALEYLKSDYVDQQNQRNMYGS